MEQKDSTDFKKFILKECFEKKCSSVYDCTKVEESDKAAKQCLLDILPEMTAKFYQCLLTCEDCDLKTDKEKTKPFRTQMFDGKHSFEFVQNELLNSVYWPARSYQIELDKELQNVQKCQNKSFRRVANLFKDQKISQDEAALLLHKSIHNCSEETFGKFYDMHSDHFPKFSKMEFKCFWECEQFGGPHDMKSFIGSILGKWR